MVSSNSLYLKISESLILCFNYRHIKALFGYMVTRSSSIHQFTDSCYVILWSCVYFEPCNRSVIFSFSINGITSNHLIPRTEVFIRDFNLISSCHNRICVYWTTCMTDPQWLLKQLMNFYEIWYKHNTSWSHSKFLLTFWFFNLQQYQCGIFARIWSWDDTSTTVTFSKMGNNMGAVRNVSLVFQLTPAPAVH